MPHWNLQAYPLFDPTFYSAFLFYIQLSTRPTGRSQQISGSIYLFGRGGSVEKASEQRESHCHGRELWLQSTASILW